MTDRLMPFVIETAAVARSRTLVYAKDYADALKALEDRSEELLDDLQERAGLPDADSPHAPYINYTAFVRPAHGFEVGGSEALQPGAPRLNECPYCSTGEHAFPDISTYDDEDDD